MRLTRTTRTSPFLYQIVPLLDVLFVLLVFFILTATFVTQPGLTVEPPASNFTVEPALRSQIISIVGKHAPQIFFRDRLVTEEQLGTLLTSQKETSITTIVVKADRAVSYDQVMSVTNLALAHGYRVVMAGAVPKNTP